MILETKTFNEQIREWNLNPFNRSEIVICSSFPSVKPDVVFTVQMRSKPRSGRK